MSQENQLDRIERKLVDIERLCAPLHLLNIFDDDQSLTISFDDTYLINLISEFEEAEENRIAELTSVDKKEQEELEVHKQKHTSEEEFIPSDDLKKAILCASAAIVVRQIIYKQLQDIKMIYFDVLNGKLSIKDARKKASALKQKNDYREVRNVRYLPDLEMKDIDNKKQKLELKKNFDELYEMHAKRWVAGKWEKRLEWYQEMEKESVDL